MKVRSMCCVEDNEDSLNIKREWAGFIDDTREAKLPQVGFKIPKAWHAVVTTNSRLSF